MSGADELADLRAQVRRLTDLERARTAALTYATVVDAGDAVAVSELFLPEGVLSIPSGDLVGRDRIAEFYLTRFGHLERRHFVTNTTTTDLATGDVEVRSYFLYLSREPDKSALGWGTYLDVVDLSGDRPLLRRKVISPTHFTDLASGWQL